MYHKLKIDVGLSRKGTHIFLNEDQAAILIGKDRIESEGHEVNPDEKEVVIDNDEPDNSGELDQSENPDEKEALKPGRKPKVSSTQNILQ